MTIWSRIKAFVSGWPEAKTEIAEEKAEKLQAKLSKMTKKQLEAYGRKQGIELDRRQSKKKLLETLLSSSMS